MSVQTPSASEDIAAARWPGPSIPWLLICLWSIYWTWHVVWWMVPSDVLSDDPDTLFALIVLSGPLLLLAATGMEAALGRRPGAFAFRAMLVHCLGCLAAGVLLFATSSVVAILGLGLVFSAILDVPVLILQGLDRRRSGLGHNGWTRLLCLLAAILGTVAVLMMWSWANAGIVAWRARDIAGSNPYCLQVNDEAGYQVVNAWSDLTGLRMTTPFRSAGITSGDTWQWAFHAVLVVDVGGDYWAYNWSHRAQSFLPLPDGPLVIGNYRFRRDVVIFCTPVPDFIETMGQHVPATPPLQRFPALDSSAYDLFNPPLMPEPMTPAASWQEAFWSRLLVRYLSIEALVEVCQIEVEPLALDAVGRSADEAGRNLGMTDEQTRDFAERIAAVTRDNGAGYCSPDNQYRRDLMAAFPRPPSVR